ncbi:MAG: hypothetical protein WKF75_11720 [Singulisphaera sp.]
MSDAAGPGPVPGGLHPGVDDYDARRRTEVALPRCYDLRVEDVSSESPRRPPRRRVGRPEFREIVIGYLKTSREGRRRGHPGRRRVADRGDRA